MSGGAWNYSSERIREDADRIGRLLGAVADTEELIDKAVCGDTLRSLVEPKLYDLWVSALDREFDSKQCDATEYIECGYQQCELRVGHRGSHQMVFCWS